MAQLKNSHAVEELPSSTAKPLASWYAQGLSDGLGDRLLMFDNSDAPSLELLRFRPDLAQVPGFEAALREQVQRLGQFRHPAFAPVRSVQRLEPDGDLALISNCTPGKRLSEVLHRARGPAFAAALIKQLAPALVQLQQHAAGISHGALNPDRIVVSPEGRLTIVEHVVGPAIDRLNLRTGQLASIGIALPPAAGGATPRLDVATDWYQLGLVAVSVLAGRPLTASDLPQLEKLLDGPGLSPFMRQWLDRALQISGTRIESGADARAAVDELLQKERPGDSRRIGSLRHEKAAPSAPSPAIIERTRHIASADEPTPGPVELFPVEQAPVPLPTDGPSAREVHAPSAVRQSPVQVRTLFGQEPSAAKTREVDSGGAAALHDPPAARRPPVHHPRTAAPARPRAGGRRTVSLAGGRGSRADCRRGGGCHRGAGACAVARSESPDYRRDDSGPATTCWSAAAGRRLRPWGSRSRPICAGFASLPAHRPGFSARRRRTPRPARSGYRRRSSSRSLKTRDCWDPCRALVSPFRRAGTTSSS